jgi:hypothetical protein
MQRLIGQGAHEHHRAAKEGRTMRAGSIAVALLVAIAATALHAAPTAQTIATADGADALIVPATSPVRYRSTGSFDDIHFAGRFVLTGVFHYGCEVDCDQPDREFSLYIVPDADQQARLPHWSRRSGKLYVRFDHAERFARAMDRLQETRLLRAGKLDEITGRVSIIVEDFTAEIECDGPSYWATFVAIEKPIQVATLPADHPGC